MVPVLDDVENFFIKLKIQKKVLPYCCNNYISVISIKYLQIVWPHSKSYQFYAVVGSTDKDPHSIDKLSILAESRRYLWNALPPYLISESDAGWATDVRGSSIRL